MAISRPIPERLWKKLFTTPSGRYDGKKFEELGLEILEYFHGDGWIATKQSHDGSRDFEKSVGDGRLWAECKAYSPSLSVYVLSPTLVMALLENAHTVIVLSRSKLNKNAVKHLAAYSAVTSKNIVSYDGATLDNAIIDAELFDRFFPGTQKPSSSFASISVFYSITSDALIRPSAPDYENYLTKINKNRSIETVRFGLIRVDIVLKNSNAQHDIQFETEVLDSRDWIFFRVVAFNGKRGVIKLTTLVRAGGVQLCELILQAKKPISKVKLPCIKFHGREAPSKNIDLGNARISKLFEIEVVGDEYLNKLNSCSHFINNRRRSVTIVIEGASGTGKSRFIRELIISGMEYGYRCHSYDSEFNDPQSDQNIVRQILADSAELPLNLPGTKQFDISTSNEYDNIAPQLARLLYDSSFSMWENISEIVAALTSLLKDKRSLILLDNVQFGSPRLIDFLLRLTEQLSLSIDNRCSIVLCFNTDFVSSDSSAGRMLTQFRAASVDSIQRERVLHCPLRDFTASDVVEFIEKVLGGTNKTAFDLHMYERTLQILQDNVQPRPLNLWQSLMYLVDSGILELRNDRLRLNKDETLLSRLKKIPSDLKSLLELRWTRVLENGISKKGIPKTETIDSLRICYILGEENRQAISSMGGSDRALDYLIQCGLIAVNATGSVRFFHQQVFFFFQRRFSIIDKDSASLLVEKLKIMRMRSRKFQQYFILSHYSHRVNGSILSATVRHMMNRGLSTEHWQQFTEILFGYLIDSNRKLGTVSLNGVCLIAAWQQRLLSLIVGAQTLRQFFVERLASKQREKLPGDNLYEFYLQAINSELAIYEDERALELISIALSDLNKCSFVTERRKMFLGATILNRKVATLKNYGRVENAIESGQQALRMFEKVGANSQIVETLFDVGAVMIGTFSHRKSGWNMFNRGCRLYEVNQSLMEEPAPCRYFYVKGQIALNTKKFLDVRRICADGYAHAERVKNHFWGIRLLMLDIAGRILENGVSCEYDNIRKLLIRARDCANTSNIERYRWGLDYLDGKLFVMGGLNERATISFLGALKILSQQLKSMEQTAWRSSVFRDIAISLRKLGQALPAEVLNSINNDALKTELLLIFTMNQEVFDLQETTHINQALLSHNNLVIELP